MNIQQLEYIIAVDDHRHFQRAAEASFVTQPTLSMMIRKLEEELKVKIFDRRQHPVAPTSEGSEIILRARRIVNEANSLRSFSKELREEISGELHLGIIPTLAPYLLPRFLKPFLKKHPGLHIYVREMVTSEIVQHIHDGGIDIGILATPLYDEELNEHPLFYEEFFAYASSDEKLPKKKYLLPKEIDVNHLWLLEEGHCLRNQVFNLCELKRASEEGDRFHYEAGSIESLINLVDHYQGITIIPQLATESLKAGQKKKVREFARPKPVREISLVTGKHFARRKLLEELKKDISGCIPFALKEGGKMEIVDHLE